MTFERVQGKGVCAASGFRAAGVTAGIKKSNKPDLALIVSDSIASVAGTFTTNSMAAAPVRVSREGVQSGRARGVVVNSGCANACTGQKGIEDAREMAALAAKAMSSADEDFLVCSTGHIGSLLPMERIAAGIEAAAANLRSDDASAAEAIMTTDTCPKMSAIRHSTGWSLGGICKGAGMIAPNMATMLAFITTDARVPAELLQELLPLVVSNTFNAITIDGDTSTNDTVLCFANGASGHVPSNAEVGEALTTVCRSLAEQIVADGEGATKIIRVRITGAANTEEARRAARAVAESLLVKTAIYGGDPNWGRVAAAIGKSQVRVDQSQLCISIAGLTLFSKGAPLNGEVHREARSGLASPQVSIAVELGAGEFNAEMLSTDLSEEYVRLNAEYET